MIIENDKPSIKSRRDDIAFAGNDTPSGLVYNNKFL